MLTEKEKMFNRLVTYTIRLGHVIAYADGEVALLMLPEDRDMGCCPVCKESMDSSECRYIDVPDSDADPGEVYVKCKNISRAQNVLDLSVNPEGAIYKGEK